MAVAGAVGVTEVRRYLGSRPDPDRTLVGVIQASPLDTDVARLALTDGDARIVTGHLLLPVDAIAQIRSTGRAVWNNGVVHEEVAVTLDEKALLPADVVIRFVKGLLEQTARIRAAAETPPVVTGGAPPQPMWKSSECYYEGCGSGDGWPRT